MPCNRLSSQHVDSQLLIQYHSCFPPTVLPPPLVMAMNQLSETVVLNKLSILQLALVMKPYHSYEKT